MVDLIHDMGPVLGDSVGGGSAGGGIDPLGQFYTFVVNDRDTLSAWVGNAPGNDYTAVLVKAGLHTRQNVSYTNITSEVIVGEPGSVIDIGNVTAFVVSPTVKYMKGLTVGTTSNPAVGIYGDSNGLSHAVLEDCTLVNAYDGQTSFKGFRDLCNLTNCHVRVANTSSQFGGYGCGFVRCKNLNGCTVTCADVGGNKTNGFLVCENLVNCKAFGEYVLYFDCKRLMFCTSDATQLNYSVFVNSTGLLGCTTPSTFNECSVGFGCSAKTFYSCYMHRSGQTMPWNSTGAGGNNVVI